MDPHYTFLSQDHHDGQCCLPRARNIDRKQPRCQVSWIRNNATIRVWAKGQTELSLAITCGRRFWIPTVPSETDIYCCP